MTSLVLLSAGRSDGLFEQLHILRDSLHCNILLYPISCCILYPITKPLLSFKVFTEERQTPSSNRSYSFFSHSFTPVFIIRRLQKLQMTKSQDIIETRLQRLDKVTLHKHEDSEEHEKNVF